MRSKHILGIDVGATGTKGAVVDLETGVLVTERLKFPTPKPSTPEAMAEVVKQLIEEIGYDEELVGCGFPAIIKDGVCHSASNIHKDWIGTDVQRLFSQVTGREFLVTNDADAAGLSEMTYGFGQGRTGTVLLITIGSGLGSALFTDGHLVRNTEFGHLPMHGGIAEKYVSNLARKAHDMSWEEFGTRFNEYLHLVERLLSPNLIILGGGVSQRYDFYSDYIDLDTEVTTAQMFNHAGIIGAALYAYELEGKNV